MAAAGGGTGGGALVGEGGGAVIAPTLEIPGGGVRGGGGTSVAGSVASSLFSPAHAMPEEVARRLGAASATDLNPKADLNPPMDAMSFPEEFE